jgi:hypothetical protein
MQGLPERVPDSREKRNSVGPKTGRVRSCRSNCALGDPVAADLPVPESQSSDDAFLRLAVPRPIAGTRVGSVYRALRKFTGESARVAFRYRRRDGLELQRTVDPHAAVFHSGRYYLVGYDVRARDWRLFALDGILGEIKRVGTFKRRAIPAAYTQFGAVGLIKTGPEIEVAIELSPEIASAVVARVWHDRQRVINHADGSSLITLPFYDVGEAVRWAMSFGTGTRIVEPEHVVRAAAKTSELLARSYAGELRPQFRESGELDLAPIGAQKARSPQYGGSNM